MFYKGKHTCKILKDIRRRIAEENDINLVIEECEYKGDCLGTCPRCEAEVRYLEEQLKKRQSSGKPLKVAGISAAMVSLLAPSCAPTNTKTTPPPDTEGIVEMLPGDVIYEPENIPEEDPSTTPETPNPEAVDPKKNPKRNTPKRIPLRGDVAFPPIEPDEIEHPLAGEPAIDIPEPQKPDTPQIDTPEIIIRDKEPLMGIAPYYPDKEVGTEENTTHTDDTKTAK